MEDIEQLLNSLYNLINQEAFDININIPVTDKAYKKCISLNNSIVETNDSPIRFNNRRLIFPHVTLKMGTVNSGHLENIIFKLENFITEIKSMELNPLPVILKAPANKYYFSEIDDDRLITISKKLDELLKDDMTFPRFPLSKNNLHHITLGYKYADDLKIAPVISDTIAPFIADRIQISIMGKIGVCIGVLKTFYLNS